MTYHEVDALIVGGGILGVSTLFHLTRNGLTNVILLEKSVLTAGSTWHASGDIGLGLDDPFCLWCANYSSQLYQKFNFETDSRIGWKQTGGLELAYNLAEEEDFERIINLAEQQDLALELISPDTASKLHPFFDFTGAHSFLFSPNDGHVDPYGTTAVMVEHSRAVGAKIIERCRATLIVQNNDNYWMISTDTDNHIRARHVILACGCYTRQIAQQLNFNLPIYAFLHHYFITEAISDLIERSQPLPIVRDEDCGGYIWQEVHGLLIGTSENRNARHIWEDGVPWEEERTLFDVDYDSVEHLLDSAVSKIPVLRKVGIRRSIRGVVTYTPDGRMFLDPIDDLQTLWICAGASSGIAWGGGIGKCLADWIVKKKAFEATELLDPMRFKGKDATYLQACAEKIFLKRGSTRAYSKQLSQEYR